MPYNWGIYETLRIIKEMREATNGRYPKFAIWENVPGAFSSNHGHDFKTVLEKISETEIPMPKSGKWANAGMVRGGAADISWRVLDAQYWGVPQRRKRIYLVADFRGQRSAEILFKPEGMSRYPAPCGETWEEIAAVTGTGTDTPVGIILNDQGGSQINVEKDNKSPTLRAQTHGHLPVVVYGTHYQHGDYEKQLPVYVLQGNMIGRKDKNGPQGSGVAGEVSYTVTATDIHAVVMPVVLENHPHDSRVNIDGSGTIQTLTKQMGTGGGNVPMVAIPINTQIALRHNRMGERTGLGVGDDGDSAFTILANHCHAVCAPSQKETDISENIEYVVRYLTPAECAKLQGFPADWHDGIVNDKGKTLPDTAAYRGYGNAVATVCAEYPLANIIEILQR